MTDEELSLFSDKFNKICEVIDGLPVHLVAPLLLRITVGTHLDMNGFTKSDTSLQLAQNLVASMTDVLVYGTERYKTERN